MEVTHLPLLREEVAAWSKTTPQALLPMFNSDYPEVYKAAFEVPEIRGVRVPYLYTLFTLQQASDRTALANRQFVLELNAHCVYALTCSMLSRLAEPHIGNDPGAALVLGVMRRKPHEIRLAVREWERLVSPDSMALLGALKELGELDSGPEFNHLWREIVHKDVVFCKLIEHVEGYAGL